MLLLLCLTLCAVCASLGAPRNLDSTYTLPEGFLLGAGTSAIQSEGAWDADGKGVNVFDHFYHTYNMSLNTDVAADSYHRYKEDIDIAASLGLNVFRLSLSWARIFPTGRKDNVNQKGVQHYHNVLDYMKLRNIEPTVTLFHFDYPQSLEDEFGGWLGDQMPDVFASWADYVFNEYGSKVRYWATVNEAAMYCNLASTTMGYLPPFTMTDANKTAICLHNLILGHALAHKVYDDKYRAKFNGFVGFGVGPIFFKAATDSENDVFEAMKYNLALGLGLSLDPLLFGDYPAEASLVTEHPKFTDKQKELIKGRIDWAGVNVYRGTLVSSSGGIGGYGAGHGTGSTETAWVLRELPKWVKERYGDLPIFISENGMQESSIDDWDTRAVYLSAFLREMVAGINENGNKVIGYTTWSFIDAFEFKSYSTGWGIVHVDYENGTLARTPKKSASLFKQIATTGVVPLVEVGSLPFEDIVNAAVGVQCFFTLPLLILLCLSNLSI